MKRLTELLVEVEVLRIEGDTDVLVNRLHQDSRQVESGDAFLAWKGHAVDGHDYISQAIHAGAHVVICSVMPTELRDSVTYVHVADSRQAAARMAAAYYDYPDRAMKMLGVTGTNGKTTVAVLMQQLLEGLGVSTGLMSTIHVTYKEHVWTATHTTPDVLQMYARWAEMREMGCEAICMEVSSHALDQDRCFGVDFDVAVFTNITREHLDYHGDFKSYLNAKKKLFDELKSDGVAIMNADDRHANYMLQNCKGDKRTYGLRGFGHYHGRLIESTLDGMIIELNGQQIAFGMTGDYNAQNLLAAFGAIHALGFEADEIYPRWSMLRSARGRFESVENNAGIYAVVDYAHTPDAITNVLTNIRKMMKAGRLIMVFGCGGDRDQGKRPLMTKAAVKQSDVVIMTSDNPRSEDPENIIDEMIQDLTEEEKARTYRVIRRAEAIRLACQLAKEGDFILVAGKGHETYQDIKGVRYPFDDKEVLREQLQLRGV